eukprot:4264580-Prymnesium_polylepis.1
MVALRLGAHHPPGASPSKLVPKVFAHARNTSGGFPFAHSAALHSTAPHTTSRLSRHPSVPTPQDAADTGADVIADKNTAANAKLLAPFPSRQFRAAAPPSPMKTGTRGPRCSTMHHDGHDVPRYIRQM